MDKIQKELVTTLLNAIIEDGKAGIHNSIQDLNVDRLNQETSKIDYAVRELINLQEDEDGFNFYIFDKWLRKSNPGAKSIECCIREMLDFYKSVYFNDVEPGEFAEVNAQLDFKDIEIKALAAKMDKAEISNFKNALKLHFNENGGFLTEKAFHKISGEIFKELSIAK